MIVKNAICFLVMIALASALQHKRPETGLAKKFKLPKPSKVMFYVDDEFRGFYVNGNKLMPQFSDADGKTWNKEKIMNLRLYTGDIITITGVNTNGFSGILGAIEFYDSKGRKHFYTTNDQWVCDDKRAIVTSSNDHNTQSLINVNSFIPKSAKFIWSSNMQLHQEVKCSFKIPCK